MVIDHRHLAYKNHYNTHTLITRTNGLIFINIFSLAAIFHFSFRNKTNNQFDFIHFVFRLVFFLQSRIYLIPTSLYTLDKSIVSCLACTHRTSLKLFFFFFSYVVSGVDFFSRSFFLFLTLKRSVCLIPVIKEMHKMYKKEETNEAQQIK